MLVRTYDELIATIDTLQKFVFLNAKNPGNPFI